MWRVRYVETAYYRGYDGGRKAARELDEDHLLAAQLYKAVRAFDSWAAGEDGDAGLANHGLEMWGAGGGEPSRQPWPLPASQQDEQGCCARPAPSGPVRPDCCPLAPAPFYHDNGAHRVKAVLARRGARLARRAACPRVVPRPPPPSAHADADVSGHEGDEAWAAGERAECCVPLWADCWPDKRKVKRKEDEKGEELEVEGEEGEGEEDDARHSKGLWWQGRAAGPLRQELAASPLHQECAAQDTRPRGRQAAGKAQALSAQLAAPAPDAAQAAGKQAACDSSGVASRGVAEREAAQAHGVGADDGGGGGGGVILRRDVAVVALSMMACRGCLAGDRAGEPPPHTCRRAMPPQHPAAAQASSDNEASCKPSARGHMDLSDTDKHRRAFAAVPAPRSSCRPELAACPDKSDHSQIAFAAAAGEPRACRMDAPGSRAGSASPPACASCQNSPPLLSLIAQKWERANNASKEAESRKMLSSVGHGFASWGTPSPVSADDRCAPAPRASVPRKGGVDVESACFSPFNGGGESSRMARVCFVMPLVCLVRLQFDDGWAGAQAFAAAMVMVLCVSSARTLHTHHAQVRTAAHSKAG